MDHVRAAAVLSDWFAANARDFPWRRSRDPYRTLLVEFLLQQTRAETGLRYFERFVERFPTIQSLARASETEVLALWSGLGYYRRARNLHASAKRIVAEHNGRVPEDVAALDGLPGIGPYTAGAIASIAYDRPEPCIDGNQARVIGRILGARNADSVSARKRIEAWARDLLGHGSPRILNQAIMDLGATVCVPIRPRCERCPLSAACRSRGTQGTRRRAAAPKPVEDWELLLHVRGDRIWLRAPSGSGTLGDVWMPPARRAKGRHHTSHFVHAFSHKTWRIRWVRARGRPAGQGRWVRRAELATLPHGPIAVRAFEAAARA